jgi:hypothetical protein
MKLEYALTQVCSTTLHRSEIEEMIRDNLISRGGDPSYDFATHHPIFIWDDRGVTIRWVQKAVFAKDSEQWRSLKPVPSRNELEKLEREKRDAVVKKTAAE